MFQHQLQHIYSICRYNVANGADLIISDGDDLIPDVLGLRPDGTFGGGALGRMRVDKLVGKDANSAVNVEKV